MGSENRIRQSILKSQAFEDAQRYADQLRFEGMKTRWFQSKDDSFAEAMKREASLVKEELLLANVELRERRRFRLKQLYAHEGRKWEEDLAAIGLAIRKIE